MAETKEFLILQADEGESFWQPKNADGFITIKTSPWNAKDSRQTVFFQEMPAGGFVGLHSHEEDQEVFIFVGGKGSILADGIEHEVAAGDVVFIGKNIEHSVRASRGVTLRFYVVVSPTGLENRLKEMGKRRTPGETAPESFESQVGRSETHGVRIPKKI